MATINVLITGSYSAPGALKCILKLNWFVKSFISGYHRYIELLPLTQWVLFHANGRDLLLFVVLFVDLSICFVTTSLFLICGRVNSHTSTFRISPINIIIKNLAYIQ